MKRILLLACAVLAMTACKKDGKGKLDPSAMIALNPCPSEWSASETKANPEHLTALQIVERATIISFWNTNEYANGALERGFDEPQRDLTNVRLLMFGTDIINAEGYMNRNFIEGRDYILEEWHDRGMPTFRKDTIAYIPDAIVRAAEIRIKAAFAKEDYAACYAIFDEAFTYTPITATEWKALKATDSN